ncbi:MAG: DNA mismatch repair protein MutS [Bacilli bacterium]|nr:DNA mismatch repair protein MutS [Bacilli bacterium]
MKITDVNYNDLSPMMKQYVEIKKNYSDAFLFYRVGDFFELFFEDASNAARELELTLTGKSAGLKEKIPMAGVPHHSVKTYIEKLIAKGFKVAICDQVEDAKHAKGMVKREVTSVISKGTMVDLEFLDGHDFNYIGSILDLNYKYILTYADISTGNIYSESILHENDNLLNRVLNLNLKEIILESNFDLKLINLFKNNYGINISLNDKFYERSTTLLNNISDNEYIRGIKHLLYYLVEIQLKDLSHFDQVKIINNDDYLLMDAHTIRNLELFETLRLKERQYSLIWLLDKCKTSIGSRTLKGFLMNPLKKEEEINNRLDYIEKLNNEFIIRSELQELLYEIYDLERLCGKVVCGSLNARDVLQIKKSLKVLPNLKERINKLNFSLSLDTHLELYELLEEAIYEEPPITLKEGYLIKEGYNKELDELKKIRSGGKNFISSLEKDEREKTGIANLRVGYNRVFGYYIEVTKGNIDKVKPEFGWERKQTLTTGERYITPLLKEKEALVLNAEEKIINLEYELFLNIRDTLKENVISLKKTAKTIGYLDALISLSVISENYKFTRPIFNNEHMVDIKNGFHPVVSAALNVEYVKNDCLLDKNTNTLLITGPNMSGKSTYMRQLAIIIILAQIGSFVPADFANLPIFDQIFTRIGASDDLVSGESTFMVEMLEARNAVVNASKNSLILFDELGRGTATYDGMSLAEAILEYINLNIGCITLFSTHYHELTELSKRINTIKNIHVSATEENGNLIFLHKIKDGSVDKSYGVNVAALAKMPAEIITRATEILDTYEKSTKKKKDADTQLAFVLPQVDELKVKLKELDILNITPIESLSILSQLKEIAKK